MGKGSSVALERCKEVDEEDTLQNTNLQTKSQSQRVRVAVVAAVVVVVVVDDEVNVFGYQ